MEPMMGPKCFLSFSLFILTVLSIYGIVGLVLNVFQSGKLLNFGEWPFNPHPIINAFIGIQSLFPVAGFFAILAVWKKNPLFIYGSGSILLGVFTCACVFGTVAYRVTTTEITDEFYNTLKKHADKEEVFNWMNDMQWKHKCCGVYSYADYWSVKTDASLVPFEGVPSSCCRREKNVPHASCGERVLSKEYNNSPVEQRIYTVGCGQSVSQTLSESLQRMGIEILGVGGVSLLVAIFLYAGITKIYLKQDVGLHPNERDTGTGPNGGDGSGAKSKGVLHNGKGTTGSITDHANNNMSALGNSFRPSSTKKIGFGIAKRKMYRRQKAHPTKFGNAFSKQTTSYNGAPMIGDANASKSFILGEAHSHLMSEPNTEGNNDKDMLRKNVDMLWYQALKNNTSTLSTIPNDISSINFPALHNKKPFLSSELMNAINEEERNTVYTLVSERPFTPSLSQNCSISFFNNYPIKVTTGTGTTETSSPTGLPSSPQFSTSKQQRLTTLAYPTRGEDEVPPIPIPIVEEEAELNEPSVEVEQPESCIAPPVPLKLITDISDTQNDNQVADVPSTDEDSSNESLLLQLSTGIPVPPATPVPVPAKFLMSSVRSSTLATIQEESESSKGSPANADKSGSSPASGYMSPAVVSPRQTETELASLARNDDDGLSINPKDNALAEFSNSDKLGEAMSKLSSLDLETATSSSAIYTVTTMSNENAAVSIAIRVGQQEFTECPSEECAKCLEVDPNMNSNSKELLPSLEERGSNISY